MKKLPCNLDKKIKKNLRKKCINGCHVGVFIIIVRKVAKKSYFTF